MEMREVKKQQWPQYLVEDLFEVQLGKMLNEEARNNQDVLPYLANFNVQWGRFELSRLNKMYFSEKEKKKFFLRKGDLLVCEGGEVGRCAIWKEEAEPCFYQKALHRLRPLGNIISTEFMLYYLQFISSGKMLSRLILESSIAHLTRETLLKLPVVVPPIAAQKRIIDTLSLWDTAIEKTERLITAKDSFKTGLMQQLLTEKRHFKEFKNTWKVFHLGELFSERNERGNDQLALLSITREEGVIFRDELDRRDTSSEDKSTYLRICPGDIGYNTMRMWQGVSALSQLEGIVSPAYTICIPNERVQSKFMAYLFKLPQVIHLFYRYSQGLTSDTWNLKFHHFAEIKVRIPSFEEQAAIAAVLETTDVELKILRQQKSALERQKRGLMQKLLTGEWRVKVADTEAA